jgi:hypothetical protein
MYQVQMQFIPGNSQIWVARMNQNDPLYEYNTEEEALVKMNELQSNDSSGRQYRVYQIG